MKLDQQHLDELVVRYFEAETSEAEEQELRRLLADDAAAGSHYDEVRAVLGYAAAGRRRSADRTSGAGIRTTKFGPRPLRATWVRRAAVVVPLLMLAGGALFVELRQHRDENVCVAYVGGQRVTDADAVMEQMHLSVSRVAERDDDLSVEGQLGDMLGDL